MSPRRAFATDLDKYCTIALGGHRRTVALARLWLLNCEFHVVVWFRFSEEARRIYAANRLRGAAPMVAADIWRRRMSRVHHVEIDPGARIGPGFYVMHRSGIFLGPVTIGDNCVLHHNVTIGQRIARGDQGVPEIGDNVWIGPGVTISGDIRIGDGVTISAGSIVSRDVPDRALVAGNPGRVIRQDYDNRSILNYAVPKQVVA